MVKAKILQTAGSAQATQGGKDARTNQRRRRKGGESEKSHGWPEAQGVKHFVHREEKKTVRYHKVAKKTPAAQSLREGRHLPTRKILQSGEENLKDQTGEKKGEDESQKKRGQSVRQSEKASQCR